MCDLLPASCYSFMCWGPLATQASHLLCQTPTTFPRYHILQANSVNGLSPRLLNDVPPVILRQDLMDTMPSFFQCFFKAWVMFQQHIFCQICEFLNKKYVACLLIQRIQWRMFHHWYDAQVLRFPETMAINAVAAWASHVLVCRKGLWQGDLMLMRQKREQ